MITEPESNFCVASLFIFFVTYDFECDPFQLRTQRKFPAIV